MIPEVTIEGVFIHGALACALFAGLSVFGVRKVLGYFGAYRWFMNPGLVDICIYLLLWGGWTWMLSR